MPSSHFAALQLIATRKKRTGNADKISISGCTCHVVPLTVLEYVAVAA